MAPTPPFQVTAIYEYKSDYDDDLSFTAGQVITVDTIEDDEWFSGTLDGRSGMFPKNFVKLHEAGVPPRPRPHAAAADEPNATSTPEVEPAASTQAAAAAAVAAAPTKAASAAASPIQIAPAGAAPVFPLKSPTKDPYAVKKQFVAAAKSSYVPHIAPRDDSKVVHKTYSEAPVREIVNHHEDAPEEPAAPQLSLKERIALIQKQQEEEAAREAAALQKQKERKLKHADEKERMRREREAEPHDHPQASPVASHHTGVSVKTLESAGDDVEEEEEAPEAPEEASDGEQPDDDDEELRRKRLVERMAKMSGGRNMFGMMGMNPFGGAAPKRASVSEVAPAAAPTPAPAAAPTPAPAAAPVPPHDASSMGDEEDDYSESDAKADPVHHVGETASVARSEAESDIETEHGSAADPDINLVPARHLELEHTGYDADEDLSDKPRDSTPQRPATPPPAPRAAARSPLDQASPVPPPHSPPVEQPPHSPPAPSAPPPPSARPPPPAPPSAPLVTASPPAPLAPPPPPVARPPPPAPPSAAPPSAAPPSAAPPSAAPPSAAPPSAAPPSAAPPSAVPPSARPPAPAPPHERPRSPTDLTQVPAGRPPIPTATAPQFEDDDESEEYDFVPAHAPPRSYTMPGSQHPDHAPPPPPPGAAPAAPDYLARASTDIHAARVSENHTGTSLGSSKRHSFDASSKRGSADMTSLHRAGSFSTPARDGASQAQAQLNELEFAIANIDSSTSWWLKDDLPESLAPKIGSELVYEVDSNTLAKRGGRAIVYKDYYILFADLSQLVFELEYEREDPRMTVKFVNFFAKAAPIVRKDLLDRYSREIGHKLVAVALTLVGHKASGGLVFDVFSKLATEAVLAPIGSKSFGVTVYRNTNNTNIGRIDDVKPGDILCIKHARFDNHKAFLGSTSVSVGDDGVFAAVVYEYDPKKDKFKVLQSDESSGVVHKESYKMGDMRSGQVRVFRVVGRSYVGW
ncbi:hypothetical protein ABC855_g2615 [[Candida] zeylanoides]